MAKATVNTFKADAGRGSTQVNTKENRREPVLDVNYITLADTAPVLIEDVPDVLDDLGLTEARRAMDTAHNEMIKTKYALAIKKALPGYLEGDGEDLLEVSPFDLLTRKQEMLPPPPTPERIQSAIDAKPFTDPAYRASAKAYLAEVLPVVENEHARLAREVNEARAELARVTREYKRKVSQAEEALQKFNNGVQTEWQKFEIANEGSRTPENFKVTTPACTPICFYSFPYWEQVEGLRAIKKAIEDYEARVQYEGSPERNKQIARYNAQSANIVKSDTQGFGGSGAPGFFGFLFSKK